MRRCAWRAFLSGVATGVAVCASLWGFGNHLNNSGGIYEDAGPSPGKARSPTSRRLKTIRGTAGDDTLIAEPWGEELYGLAGNDHLIGALSAGDTINGFGGDDYIQGRGGADWIDAGDGNDIVSLGEGKDYVNGGTGDDVIICGPGQDDVKIIARTKERTNERPARTAPSTHPVYPGVDTIRNFQVGEDMLFLHFITTPEALSTCGERLYYDDELLAVFEGVSAEAVLLDIGLKTCPGAAPKALPEAP